jgi:predicted RecA/RadA family phage recombinase
MDRRKKWDRERMWVAIEAIKKEQMGCYKASGVFNLPQTTLQRYVKRPTEKLK